MALSRRRKIIIGISAVVLLAAIILISVFATRKDVPEVNTVKVEKRRELKSTVTASGEVRPIQYINLTSEVQGRIVEIYVKEGDVVTKGQELVRLDPTQLESTKDAQEAALRTAEDEVQVSRSQIIAAQNQYSQSQQSLVAVESTVQTALQQVESAKQQVRTAQEAVNSAHQQVISAQIDVERAQNEVDIAKRELRRATELLESGVIARLEYDQAKDRVDNANVALRTSKANLEFRKSAVSEAQTRVRQAQLSVNEAQTRVKEALARVNQQKVAVKDALRSVNTAELNTQSGLSRVNQQRALLRGSSSQKDKTLQLAPLNGIVAEIPSKIGTFATAGLSTTALMTIADMSSVNVEVKVDETEIDKVAVGQAAKIKVDALGEKELTGEVTQKTPLALGKSQTTGGLSTNINVQEAKEFRVVIQIKDLADDVRDSLRPGMSATATITTQTAKEVLTVPLQAIVNKLPNSSPTPAGENNNNTANPSDKPKPIEGVYILESGKAKFVEITKGITGESDIEITSGLSEGMEVITGPSRILKTLKEGDVVKKQVKKEGTDNANK